MNKISRTGLIILGLVFLAFQAVVIADENSASPMVYQVSAWDPFFAGDYSAQSSVGDLKTMGTMAIGGYEHMNGELLELNGRVWQITIDGVVTEPTNDTGVCFATITSFKPTITYSLHNSIKKDEILTSINNSFPDPNSIYAFQVEGSFSEMNVRSVPAQSLPYPNLTRVIEDQSVFNLTDVNGTICGFWFPEWMRGVNYAGFHPHFITSDFTAGGHVLDCTAENITMSIQPLHHFTMILPEDKE